jgi:hypothetical protein
MEKTQLFTTYAFGLGDRKPLDVYSLKTGDCSVLVRQAAATSQQKTAA